MVCFYVLLPPSSIALGGREKCTMNVIGIMLDSFQLLCRLARFGASRLFISWVFTYMSYETLHRSPCSINQ